MPCAFVVMLAMRTHSENPKVVGSKLWDILADAYQGDFLHNAILGQVFLTISKAIKKAELDSEQLKQLYDSVRPFVYHVPGGPKWDEADFLIAYIYYTNESKFKPLYYKICDITDKIISLEDILDVIDDDDEEYEAEIRGEIRKLSCEVRNIYSEIEAVATQIVLQWHRQ
jgi:hypothetical protein